MTPPSPMSDVLTEDELLGIFGPVASQWAALGITANRCGEHTRIWHGTELIGWTGAVDEFPGLHVYFAVVASVQDAAASRSPEPGQQHGFSRLHKLEDADAVFWGVGFPAGFVPPDPARAADAERRRWAVPGRGQ